MTARTALLTLPTLSTANRPPRLTLKSFRRKVSQTMSTADSMPGALRYSSRLTERWSPPSRNRNAGQYQAVLNGAWLAISGHVSGVGKDVSVHLPKALLNGSISATMRSGGSTPRASHSSP